VIEGKASQTALGSARARAAHQVIDKGDIFADPAAIRILGTSESELRESLGPMADDPKFPAMRLFMAGRSRFAEDNLRRAVDAGVRQYVVLGAGLDTFATRNPYAHMGLKVFEVDHPATQAWKRDMLSQNNLTATAIFTPVDFERQDLVEELKRAGMLCLAWRRHVLDQSRHRRDFADHRRVARP
jgi:methyltransferase (TIGR00027 family)